MEPLVGGDLVAGRSLTWLDSDLYWHRYPITYGIELQFLVPVLAKGRSDPHPHETRRAIVVDEGASLHDIHGQVTGIILDIIRSQGIPAWTHLGPPFPLYEMVKTFEQESQAVSQLPEYSQWVVEVTEDLLDLLRGKDPFQDMYTEWVGVKVRSSKRDSSWENHFDQIGNVIRALRNTLRIRPAPTSTLSVHVGEARRDIDVYETGPVFLRNFCTMWWFVEDHIQSLAHPSRREHPDCQPLRKNSKLATMSDYKLESYLERGGMDDVDFGHYYKMMNYITPFGCLLRREQKEIESIWRSRGAKKLTRKMEVWTVEMIDMDDVNSPTPGGKKRRERHDIRGRGSVGFQGFCEGARKTIPTLRQHNNGETGTLEFRSMESTLDPQLIFHWVAVVMRLFDFCRRGNTSDIMAVIVKAARRNTYTGIQLLEDIGIPLQARYFERKISTHGVPNTETMETLFVPPYP
ncbi:hypothetical protein GGR54DRAFT_620675 [Hypoxylon sp. NC1633]|nr:hypothetical protein GGR54DRAFT_620675 [Hypoxylon sp. NC1633]